MSIINRGRHSTQKGGRKEEEGTATDRQRKEEGTRRFRGRRGGRTKRGPMKPSLLLSFVPPNFRERNQFPSRQLADPPFLLSLSPLPRQFRFGRELLPFRSVRSTSSVPYENQSNVSFATEKRPLQTIRVSSFRGSRGPKLFLPPSLFSTFPLTMVCQLALATHPPPSLKVTIVIA